MDFYEQVGEQSDKMEKVLSMDDLQDPFWAPSPVIAGVEQTVMNRCPSESLFAKYLEEMAAKESASSTQGTAYSRVDSNPRVLPIRDPTPSPSTNAAVSSLVPSLGMEERGEEVGGEDEVVEIKGLTDPFVARIELSTADPVAYTAFLTKELNISCAAASLKLQGVGMISQDSSIAESRTDSSSLGSEAAVKGTSMRFCGGTVPQADSM